MAKTDVLARVAADLAQGHTQPAIQRLSSLVARHPTDLDLRRRLAAVHRMVGDRVEAGRWSYLDAAGDPAETAAFEAAYPNATRRLHALRWPAGAATAATEHARGRLDALAAAADTPARDSRAGAAIFATVVLIALVFAVIGAVTLVQWLR